MTLRNNGIKNKTVAAILAIILGNLGIHRFYLGDWLGILYLVFCWTFIPGLVGLIEGIWFLMMSPEEFDERYN